MKQIIPLTNANNQTLTTTLQVNGTKKRLRLFLVFNSDAGYWEMTITDLALGSNALLTNIPIITGAGRAADILKQYQYLGIGHAMILKIGADSTDYPDAENLESEYALVWYDDNE